MKTQCRDDGVRCAFELVTKYQCDLLFGIGGDGSLGSVLNGLILGCLHLNPNVLNSEESSRQLPVHLGVIPSGTGNDFVRTLLETSGDYYLDIVDGFENGYFEDSVSKIVDMIISDSKTIPIDVGRMDYTPSSIDEEFSNGNDTTGVKLKDCNEMMKSRFFLNASTIGIGPEILKSVNDPNSFLPKSLQYYIQPILKEFTYKNPLLELDITSEKKICKKMQLVIVSNGRYVNNGFKMNPFASLTNNQLDLCIVEDVGVFDLHLFYYLKYGTHLNYPKVIMESTKSLTVDTKECVFVECDGDVIGMLPVMYKVMPSVVNVLVPKSFTPTAANNKLNIN